MTYLCDQTICKTPRTETEVWWITLCCLDVDSALLNKVLLACIFKGAYAAFCTVKCTYMN